MRICRSPMRPGSEAFNPIYLVSIGGAMVGAEQAARGLTPARIES
jgi:hypothetical protein